MKLLTDLLNWFQFGEGGGSEGGLLAHGPRVVKGRGPEQWECGTPRTGTEDGWGATSPSSPPSMRGGGALSPATKHLLIFPTRDKVKLKGINHERKTSRGQSAQGGRGL